MKKLILSLAIALTVGVAVNAQEVGEANVPYLTLNKCARKYFCPTTISVTSPKKTSEELETTPTMSLMMRLCLLKKW
jgi:hypothetical protein